MRRFDAEREADTRPDIKSYRRFEETPPEIVIELDKEAKTLNLVGTKADARAADRLETLLDLLPSDPPGLTVHEILERWPSFDARFPAEAAVPPRPAISSLRRDLETAKALGLVHVIGDGTEGTPFRYHT